MNKIMVTQNIYEKQCFSIAHKLIEEVIAIKSSSAPSVKLSESAKIKRLIDNLDSWVEGIVRQGGL